MKFDEVIHALNFERRREIIKLLCKRDMSAPQIYVALGKDAPVYRQSVNKSLEILKKAGLIEKYYDDEKKALYYRVKKKVITLYLDRMTID